MAVAERAVVMMVGMGGQRCLGLRGWRWWWRHGEVGLDEVEG